MRLNKTIWTGLVIAGIGIIPLLLYGLLGPKDGNPIGLGLLFITATPLGVIFLIVGLFKKKK